VVSCPHASPCMRVLSVPVVRRRSLVPWQPIFGVLAPDSHAEGLGKEGLLCRACILLLI